MKREDLPAPQPWRAEPYRPDLGRVLSTISSDLKSLSGAAWAIATALAVIAFILALS